MSKLADEGEFGVGRRTSLTSTSWTVLRLFLFLFLFVLFEASRPYFPHLVVVSEQVESVNHSNVKMDPCFLLPASCSDSGNETVNSLASSVCLFVSTSVPMFAAGLDSPGVYRSLGGGGPDVRQLSETGERPRLRRP